MKSNHHYLNELLIYSFDIKIQFHYFVYLFKDQICLVIIVEIFQHYYLLHSYENSKETLLF